ncbi:DUF6207 family protein [Streptomyces sp. NPDC059447]|uniref:DUF6207 family protein n=1 Tax=Streptomyces sp. NPDC059447 TaxID=3346834 RepID=UPI0036827CC2
MPAAEATCQSLVRVEPRPPANRAGSTAFAADLKRIDEQHIAEPGLVVLDITGRDEETARAIMATLEQRWATSAIAPVRRDPGKPDLRAPTPTSCARAGKAHSWGGCADWAAGHGSARRGNVSRPGAFGLSGVCYPMVR